MQNNYYIRNTFGAYSSESIKSVTFFSTGGGEERGGGNRGKAEAHRTKSQ